MEINAILQSNLHILITFSPTCSQNTEDMWVSLISHMFTFLILFVGSGGQRNQDF